MSLKELISDNLKLNTSKIYFDEPMNKHTTFKIGGPAEVFIKVRDVEDLKQILKFKNENNITLTVIGNGSNILVSDKGINGIVAKIEIKKFEIKQEEENIEITVGSGNKNIEIAQNLLKNDISETSNDRGLGFIYA